MTPILYIFCIIANEPPVIDLAKFEMAINPVGSFQYEEEKSAGMHHTLSPPFMQKNP
jgi:hypothetical protein